MGEASTKSQHQKGAPPPIDYKKCKRSYRFPSPLLDESQTDSEDSDSPSYREEGELSEEEEEDVIPPTQK